MHESLIQIAWIAFFSIFALWLGWRLKIPAIVFFLSFGFIAGPVLELVNPQNLLGDLLQPLTTIAVGIILFEGALNLNFKEIGRAKWAIRNFTIIGAPVAWILTSAAGYYIGGLSLPVAVTFGALLIVTGPTVIMPLLKNARLTERPSSILKWEGLINDPIGAVLAVLAYEYFKDSARPGFAAIDFFTTTFFIILGIALASALFGILLSRLFNRGLIPEYLKPAFLLSFVVILTVACNQILHESGLIAVTILGVTLANSGVSSLHELKRFKETMSLMLVAGIFIILTAKIDPTILTSLEWPGILFILTVLLVIRPITALASSIGTQMDWREIVLTGWIAPRGIVCAAVAAVMGPLLVDAGFEDGESMLPLAFAIVMLTVILHGLSAKPLGKLLGLTHPEKDSLILVGAANWTLQLAEVLRARDIEVVIADKNWYALKQARLSEIPTYYGEILSEETEYNIELSKYNAIAALTNNPAYNALVCSKFAHDFSRERTYQLVPYEDDTHESKQITEKMRGMNFMDPGTDYWEIANLFNQGWRFRSVRIDKDHNMDDIKDKIDDGTLRIVGYQKGGNNQKRLVLYAPENFKSMQDGDALILFEKREPAHDEDE